MQAPDEPRSPRRPTTPALPSPEQLGLAPTAYSAVDWNGARGKLHDLKATCYQLDRLTSGDYRFTCWLPAEQTGKSYRVEAEGSGEAEAVQKCLERAERWARRTP
jgi:hypothetical protein